MRVPTEVASLSYIYNKKYNRGCAQDRRGNFYIRILYDYNEGWI